MKRLSSSALRLLASWTLCSAASGALSLGCEPKNSTPEQQAEPPAVVNADLVPAPVGADPAQGSGLDPATKPAREARAERAPLPFDLLRPPEGEAPSSTEATEPTPLISLEARWVFAGQTVPNFPGLEPEQIEVARLKTGSSQNIDLLPTGRMRLQLLGGAFSLQAGTQLLARSDRTGWLLLWPGLDQYRALAAGSLLSVFREGRADTTPLLAARIESERPLKERRFGFPVVRTLLTTNRGSLTLDQVEIPDAATAGVCLCRLLAELITAAPNLSVCDGRGVPVRAHYEYAGGTLDWTVDALKQRTEGYDALLVPPQRGNFVTLGLPAGSRAFLGDTEAAALRKSDRRGRLKVANHDLVGAFLTLDGAPIAFIAPKHSVQLDLPQGDLRLGVRDFAGVELQPPKLLKLESKAHIAWRTPDDAGAPKSAQSSNSSK